MIEAGRPTRNPPEPGGALGAQSYAAGLISGVRKVGLRDPARRALV